MNLWTNDINEINYKFNFNNIILLIFIILFIYFFIKVILIYKIILYIILMSYKIIIKKELNTGYDNKVFLIEIENKLYV